MSSVQATLAQRFKRIKTAIGGNRERFTYEETFGLPREEQFYITMPNAWQRRIIGELEFGIHLNEACSERFTDALTQAMTLLQQRLDDTGVVAKDDALAAEACLLPMQSAAKEYSLILAAHAHLDMNWMWSWQETVTATLETFRTMLHMMQEYPDFHFSQSQASVYKIVEDYEPTMMDEIKQRIREGRWEVTASAWVETDKNMPSTESLARHILYTKQYLHNTWNVPMDDMNIDFSPDTFGHSAHLPELVSHGGVKYYYHCRGNDYNQTLYRWKAPSGQEIMVYREPYWYNSGITPHIGAGLLRNVQRSGGLKTGLIVYGVGDHGGGPTRRDIERAQEMMQWPIYPNIRFGTLGQYFAAAESVRDNLQVFDDEINFIFTGCLTTQSRIKLGNKHSEMALYESEALSACATLFAKGRYNTEGFEGAWHNVLFTHFHDILTGSCVQDSREHAMGLYSHSLAVANTETAAALRSFANMIDTSSLACPEDISASQSEGAGAGYGIEHFTPPIPERGAGIRRIFHAFNPSARARTAMVDLTVWDWRGDLRQLQFTGPDGQVLPHQLQGKMERYWDHQYFKMLVQADLPAGGYITLVMDETPIDDYTIYYQPDNRVHAPYADIVLENQHVQATFCYQSGALVSFVDKTTSQQLIQPGKPACLTYVEADGKSDSAWIIGQYKTVTPLADNAVVRPLTGALRSGLTIEVPFQSSTAKATITLDKDSCALQFDLEVDFNEYSRPKGTVPTLIFAVPHAYEAQGYMYDVPAGNKVRLPQHLDVPGLLYGAAVNPNGPSLALVTDCKYGYRGTGDRLSVTLIHAANAPDPYPERGIHKIKMALVAGMADAAALEQQAFDLVHPPLYMSARPNRGSWPMSGSMYALANNTTAVLSGVKLAEDGSGLVMRLYNMANTATQATLAFMQPVKAAVGVDIMEQETGKVQAQGNEVTVALPACGVGAVKVMF